jgi:hypothetical protein
LCWNHVADLAHRVTGVVPQNHNAAGYFAPRLADRLSDLARHDLRQLFGSVADRRGPFVKMLGACGTREGAPRRERPRSGTCRSTRVVRRTLGHECDDVAHVGRIYIIYPSICLAVTPAIIDEVLQSSGSTTCHDLRSFVGRPSSASRSALTNLTS